MTPQEMARVYVQSIELEELTGATAPELTDKVGELRSNLHALLMEVLREHHVPFVDRFDASRLAYQLVRETTPAA